MSEKEETNGWKSKGTSTKILIAVVVQTMVLTVLTWAAVVIFKSDTVAKYIPSIVMLILTPAGLAITQYQISKFQNRQAGISYTNLNNGFGPNAYGLTQGMQAVEPVAPNVTVPRVDNFDPDVDEDDYA